MSRRTGIPNALTGECVQKWRILLYKMLTPVCFEDAWTRTTRPRLWKAGVEMEIRL